MIVLFKKTCITLFIAVLFAGCSDANEPTKPIIDKNLIPKVSKSKQEIVPEPYPFKKIHKQSSVASKSTIKNFDFDIVKKGFKDNNTLLIVGGIQGDEPGGFTAASLIATHYEITKGSVWIVPNLNFYSIIKRSRGPHGDMNRKFANLAKTDPEYETIQRIKEYINDDSVKLIVNMHDGSGYYRPTYIDDLHSPKRWGQCSIIDQETLKGTQYSNLLSIANDVVTHVNKNLIKEQHIYHLHNTRTNEGDMEMEKTLTYYAINKGKAAFGNEASKSLPTHQRTYYHLLALEKYMDIMGIEYKRKFNLNSQELKNIIDHDIQISLYDDAITLPLSKIRNRLNYFPITKDGIIDFTPSSPLISVVKNKNEYSIYHGNRRLTILSADYMNYEKNTQEITLQLDGKKISTPLGSVLEVNESFLVESVENYRVNVIGYTNTQDIETDIAIKKQDIMKRFSIDTDGKIYRIEFYAKEKFAGMILVKFK